MYQNKKVRLQFLYNSDKLYIQRKYIFKSEKSRKENLKVKNKIKYVVLVLSLCLIFWGMDRGEVKVVLKKAINICRECIGIG